MGAHPISVLKCVTNHKLLLSIHVPLASYPGREGGGGKAAWYLMFAHA